ncbi:TPA: hypothetical protein J1Y36_002891 [Escherichia coli]|nr:hypothetical protein [Escherichia coli]
MTPRIPAAADHPEYAAHCFDAELSLMFFNKDILHSRRFAKYVAALCLLRWLPLQGGIFSGQFTFSLKRGSLLLQFAAPHIEMSLIQTEFTGCNSDTDAFRKLQGFTAKFRRMLFTIFLLVDTVFVI